MIIAFHKPYGVLCQFTPDQPGQRTLGEFGFPKGVYPLGRLDLDSEGLLILSDEKGLNDRLLNPKNAHDRTYLVQIEGIPTMEKLEKLGSGSLFIKNYCCLPCHAKIPTPQPDIPPRVPPIRIRKTIPDTWIELSLTEGKNRPVRRMTAAIGHPTLRLLRIAIGGLKLGNLPNGKWIALNETQRNLIGVR